MKEIRDRIKKMPHKCELIEKTVEKGIKSAL